MLEQVIASANLQEVTIDNKVSTFPKNAKDLVHNITDNLLFILMREFRGTSLRLIHAYFAELEIETLRSIPWAC